MVRTQAKGDRQWGAEGSIWTAEGASDRGLEVTGRLHCEKRDGLYCYGKQTQMDGACGTDGGEDKCVQRFGGEP